MPKAYPVQPSQGMKDVVTLCMKRQELAHKIRKMQVERQEMEWRAVEILVAEKRADYLKVNWARIDRDASRR